MLARTAAPGLGEAVVALSAECDFRSPWLPSATQCFCPGLTSPSWTVVPVREPLPSNFFIRAGLSLFTLAFILGDAGGFLLTMGFSGGFGEAPFVEGEPLVSNFALRWLTSVIVQRSPDLSSSVDLWGS